MISEFVPLVSVILAGLFVPQVKVPRFEDYPARDTLRGTPAAPNLTNPDDQRFRTALRLGAAKGPNFAGAFTVVLWGCGSPCQSGAVIDARTGSVWSLPRPLTRRAQYKLSSRLFVAD